MSIRIAAAKADPNDPALKAAFARVVDANGQPVTGRTVTIVIDPATNQVTDITVQAS